MIVLGIILMIISIGIFILSGLSCQKERPILGVWLCILAIFSWASGMSCIVNESKSDGQKIECSEIKQIDTLYKNDSIIGYEVIILK